MTAPRRELHLHVGLPKTGTSAIQAGLLANRERLVEAGLHLAPMHDLKGQHHPLALLLEKQGADAFLSILHKGNNQKQLVSSEMLVFIFIKKISLLERVLDGFEGALTVHLTLRRWDAFCQSVHPQLLRNHLGGWRSKPPPPITKFIARDGEVGSEVLERMAEVAERIVARRGPDALRISAYPETGPRNAFRTFLDVVLPGVARDGFVEDSMRNPSLHRRKMLLIEAFGRVPTNIGGRLLQRVTRSTAVRDDGVRTSLSPEARASLVVASSEPYRRMARLGGLPKADLAALLASPPPDPDWYPPAPITPSEAFAFVTEGWRPAELRGGGLRGLPRRLAAELWLANHLSRRWLTHLHGKTTSAERMT